MPCKYNDPKVFEKYSKKFNRLLLLRKRLRKNGKRIRAFDRTKKGDPWTINKDRQIIKQEIDALMETLKPRLVK